MVVRWRHLSGDFILRTKMAALLYQLGRFGLSAVFIWSGLTKAANSGFFTETIAAFGLLPGPLLYPVAIVLIVAELSAGVGLMFERRGSLSIITLLLLLFMAVLGYGIYLGLDVDCGCFGPNDPEAQAFHDLRGSLVRDLFLLAVIVYLYLWRFFNRLTSPRVKPGIRQLPT